MEREASVSAQSFNLEPPAHHEIIILSAGSSTELQDHQDRPAGLGSVSPSVCEGEVDLRSSSDVTVRRFLTSDSNFTDFLYKETKRSTSSLLVSALKIMKINQTQRRRCTFSVSLMLKIHQNLQKLLRVHASTQPTNHRAGKPHRSSGRKDTRLFVRK